MATEDDTGNAETKRSKRGSEEKEPARPFLIVGLGASAGGLGALEEFFSRMPSDSGVAFVVITHQRPGRTSLMAELLARKTEMPVVQVSKATPVEPDHVYTVHPGFNLAILGGVLQPMELDDSAAMHMPVDYFFRSLAQDQNERAVGIVLSGTGTDGSLGLKEIKGALGMVMVQEEQSAQYTGMPHSAISTTLVDFVLPAGEMPERLLAFVKRTVRGVAAEEARVGPPPEALQQIFVVIRERTGHDFSHYKMSTVRRRIERRMTVHRVDTMKQYVRYLQANSAEVDLLFRELLIGVTSFFRDPQAWDALSRALTDLLADRPEGHVVRIWVPGCSTGEEAYSVAIILREKMVGLKRAISVQIFATDLDAKAVDVARAGLYPSGIANDVSAERLSRFFTHQDDAYRVKKEIRDMVVFAQQNLIADPPFTRLDLISCRNLLIYLDAKLQKKLLPVFHYALSPGGVLFLGSSESIGAFTDLFSTLDKKWKLFRRSNVPPGRYQAEIPPVGYDLPTAGQRITARVRPHRGGEQVVNRLLLDELVPPTVLVREHGDVVHVHGRTGLYLEPAPGSQSTANIFNMARPGLQLSVSAAIRQASSKGEEVIQRGIQVKANGGFVPVDIRVSRVNKPEALRGLFRVTFERSRATEVEAASGAARKLQEPGRIVELEQELRDSQESHQATIEELEAANEELKSTNEELQSTNEELQSTNEELETSKEELQSLNEELRTVNSELEGKVDELSHANDDMNNLLNSTDIAIVFLDSELRIKRYTESAKNIIRLIPTDVGRPLGDLVSTLRYDRLVDDARDVLRTLVFKEAEVRGGDDEWYLMRILPYRTTENVIDGLVFTFVDVTKLRALQAEQRRLLAALRSSPAAVFGQDTNLRFTWVSNTVFGREPSELVGKSDKDIFAPEDSKQLLELKQAVLDSGVAGRDRLNLWVGSERRIYDLYVEPQRDPDGEIRGLSCVSVDVTVRE